MINESISRINDDHKFLIIKRHYWYPDAVMMEKISEVIRIA
jgi:hypothetical protein